MYARFSSLLLFIFGACVIMQSGRGAKPASVHQARSFSAVEARAAVSRDQYTKLISQTYDYRFGSHRPFLPGNATTQDGRFLPPGSFPTAAYCGACHQAAYREWSESAHRSSFRAPFYKKNVDILIQGKGIEFSRHCESCHDPIALFSGALTNGSSVKRSFDNDGITCSVCHSISKLQPSYGVGSYVMGVPAVIVDKSGRPIPGTVPYEEILLHPDRHRQAVMRDIYKSPEFCGSCHEASLPRSLDGYKWLRAISTYDEWRKSAYSQRSPSPFYRADYKSCQDCHMPRQRIAMADLGAKDGMLASHRWLGGNTAIPLYYGFQDQLSATEAFLAKQRVTIDIFGLKSSQSPTLIAPLGQTSFSIASGTKIQAMLVIRNRSMGHSLIPEQRDFYQAWVEFTVTDQSGKELLHSGYLQPDGKLDPHAYSFTNRLINESGNLLTHHEIWERRAVAWDKTIPSGQAVIVRYEFLIPKSVTGPLILRARVNYRHFNQAYLNFVLGPRHPAYPVVKMAEVSRRIEVGANVGGSNEGLKAPPEWMRWNNYGIALLNEGLYGKAASAFRQVEQARPGYADGVVNLGMAELRMEQYPAALQQFKRALRLDAHSDRARFYLALAERSQGDLRLSAENLQAVAARFPESADVHRELGICYYLERRYRHSRDEFRNVQAIAPDDLTAHYYLALLYKRFGSPSLARQQARAYEDEKRDPSAPTIALRYLSSGQDLYGESLSTHVYGLPAPATQVSANKVTPVSHPRLLLSASEGGSGEIGKGISNSTGGKHLK